METKLIIDQNQKYSELTDILRNHKIETTREIAEIAGQSLLDGAEMKKTKGIHGKPTWPNPDIRR